MFFDLSIIEPGQKLFLYLEGDMTRYVSYVREVKNKVIFFDPPEKREAGPESDMLSLSDGASVRVQLPVLGHLYQFGGSVLQPGSTDLPAISVPDRVDRVEMRRFVRVKKMLRVQYAVLSPNGEEPLYKYAESINISAGGMQLYVSEYIGQGEQLVLQFIISQDNKYSRFKEMSRVSRVIQAGGKDRFYIGVEFLNIKKNKLDFISKYVMKTIWIEGI